MSSKVFNTSFTFDQAITKSNPHLKVTFIRGETEIIIKPEGEPVPITWTKESALYVSALEFKVVRLGGEQLLDNFSKANSANIGLMGHDWSKNRTCQITLSKESEEERYKFTTLFKSEPITWSDITSRFWSRKSVLPDDS